MRRTGLTLLLFVLLIFAPRAGQAFAEKRVALIIGNSSYEHATPLKNPKNDADAFADVLTRLGFQVVKGTNLNRADFEKTVREFSRALRGADVALLFYAGHGLQVEGRNYLVPVDATLGDIVDLDFETLPVASILKHMEREVRTNLVFLDACRDNPLARNLSRSMGTRSGNVRRGLARIETGIGTLIAFATEPGNVALDGEGDHSPFAQALLKHIETPGLDVAQLLRRVRVDVMAATDSRQVPWNNSSLTGDFYFSAPKSAVEAAPQTADAEPPALPPPADTTSLELAFWDAIKDSNVAADYESYLERFPDGTFSDLAIRRMKQLGEKQASLTPPDKPREAFDRVEIAVKLGSIEVEKQDRAWLGVRITNVSGTMAKCWGLEPQDGAFVSKLVDDSPAKKAGLRLGDIITSLDGKKVATNRALVKFIGAVPIGARVTLDILRTNITDEGYRRLLERANNTDSDAMYCLGYLTDSGTGLEQNGAEAARWYRKAAEAGNASAMLNLGAKYADGKDVQKDQTEAVRWYRKAADLGERLAMRNLGYHYDTGVGVDKDVLEGVRWCRKAAELGDPVSAYRLARRYAYGRGVAKDNGEAVRWYRKAANLGSNSAMTDLGYHYDNGLGVEKDRNEAARWYRKAAELGNRSAMTNLGIHYADGLSVAKDVKEAIRWFRKAAALGDSWGMNRLGYHYVNGLGVKKDFAEAARWYRKAAELGNTSAMHSLGLRYKRGEGVKKDRAESVKWFQKSAAKGYLAAHYQMAIAQDEGAGTAKDAKGAAEWMFKAIKGGYAFSAKEMKTNSTAWSVEFRRELQRLMKQEGAYTDGIDGQFGPATARAIDALVKK